MSFKVEKLTVSKGKTVMDGKGDYIKVNYGLEMDVSFAEDSKQVEDVKLQAETLLDIWLAPYSSGAPRRGLPSPVEGSKLAEQAKKIPDLDIADINELPWKGKAGADHRDKAWGWIFTEPQKAPEHERKLTLKLGEAIRKAKGSLVLGEYEYKFSGANSKFINRKMVKQ